jgi:HD-GYP domain-containing protein (c-di-GMP phosphodiesterase class II)
MTSTQDLLGIITALRQRLEKSPDLANRAGPLAPRNAASYRLQQLRQQLTQGRQEQRQVQHALGQGAYFADDDNQETPEHLSNRASGLLEQSREIVLRLRNLADYPLLRKPETHLPGQYYQDTVLLAELVLRTLHTLPEQPFPQFHFCSAAEVLLGQVQERIKSLYALLKQDSTEENLVARLANLLNLLVDGKVVDLNPFYSLAETIAEEVNTGNWLRFPVDLEKTTVRLMAAHGVSVARVIARVGTADPEWRPQLLRPIVAALVHDVGMLTVSSECLAREQNVDVDDRVLIERHTRAGANILARVAPEEKWLIDAALSHHERPDGTGYPTGLSDMQIDPLVKLLSVCDVYAALRSPRPHREALDSKNALLDTLAIAQNGGLDRHSARTLMYLTSYPPGAGVELSDGSNGIVAAKAPGREEVDRPVAPVVMVLTDAARAALPFPTLIDLSQHGELQISRGLSPREQRSLFADRFPQWA